MGRSLARSVLVLSVLADTSTDPALTRFPPYACPKTHDHPRFLGNVSGLNISALCLTSNWHGFGSVEIDIGNKIPALLADF